MPKHIESKLSISQQVRDGQSSDATLLDHTLQLGGLKVYLSRSILP